MYVQPGLKCYSLGDNLLRRLVDCVSCVMYSGLKCQLSGDYRKELGTAGGQGPVNPPRPTKRSGFTSTPVLRYSGKSSWAQYWQVFAAIVCSFFSGTALRQPCSCFPTWMEMLSMSPC